MTVRVDALDTKGKATEISPLTVVTQREDQDWGTVMVVPVDLSFLFLRIKRG